MPAATRPTLLLLFYGDPDLMPMIFKESALLRERFRVYILAESRISAMEWPGIEIERVKPATEHTRIKLLTRVGKNVDYLKFIRIARRRIRELRPAVLYAHDPRAMVAAIIANRSFDLPIVYRCHDIYEDLHGWHSLQGYIERYAARAGLKAKLVIQYSDGRAEHFRNLAASSYPNIVVTPNYASLAMQPNRQHLDDIITKRFERMVIAYPGTIQDFVAIEDLVGAVALLNDKWSLSMFGQFDREVFENAMRVGAELGIGKRLRHGGWIPPDQVLTATNFDTVGAVLFKPISVNYTSMGTASNKLWEFAARAIPVVVPDTPDFRRVLDGERWVTFFKIGDPKTMADAINRMTSNLDEYRRASLSAYEAVRSKYNFEKVFPIVLNALLAAARADLLDDARSAG